MAPSPHFLLFVFVIIIASTTFGAADEPPPQNDHQQLQELRKTRHSLKNSVTARIRRLFRRIEASFDADVPHEKVPSTVLPTVSVQAQAAANTQGGRCITSMTVSHVNPAYTMDLYYYGQIRGKPAHFGCDWDGVSMIAHWNDSHWVLVDGQFTDHIVALAVGKETTTAADASQVKTWLLPSGQSKSSLTIKCAAVAKVNKKACTTQLIVKGFTSSADSYLNGAYLYDGVFSGKSYYRGFRNGTFVYIYWMDSRTVTGWCINGQFLTSPGCEAWSVGITDAEPTTVTKWASYYDGDDSLILTCTKGTSAKCAKFKCGSGYILRDNAQYLTCKGAKCTKDECCHAVSCAKFVCPNGHALRTDAAQIPCWDARCQPAECCLGQCSGMDCVGGHPLPTPSSTCRKYNCDFDECCEAGDFSSEGGSSFQESSWY